MDFIKDPTKINTEKINQNFKSENNNKNINKNNNLNVFLPNIDNSYLANHIQDEVFIPILDETSISNYYNVPNEIDFSNEIESVGYDSKRQQNILFNQPPQLFNYNLNQNLKDKERSLQKNLINENNNINNKAYKAKQTVNPIINQKNNNIDYNINKNLVNLKELDNSDYFDFSNIEKSNSIFVKNSNKNNNFYSTNKDDDKYFNNLMKSNGIMNMKNFNNTDFFMNYNGENIWADSNYGFHNQNKNNKKDSINDIPQEFILQNNNFNFYKNEFYSMKNNLNENYVGSPYNAMSIDSNKMHQNSIGFNNNNNMVNAKNYTSFNSMNMNSPNFKNLNPNIIMNMNNNNFAIKSNSFNSSNNNNKNIVSANKISKFSNGNKKTNANQVFLLENIQANISYKNSKNNEMKIILGNSPVNNDFDHNMISMKLNRNISNYTELSNDELARFALMISKDQCGCRFIQKKISENSDFSNNYLFPHVIFYYFFIKIKK